VDVRVIAATNRNLREAVEAGRFRSDLFYRLNVFPIDLPPLRERRSDIPQLVAFCVTRFSKRLGKKIDGVSQESMENLVNYPWPGNIRELQNVIERAVVLSVDPTLRLDRDLMPVTASAKGMAAPETDAPERQPPDPKSPQPPTSRDYDRNWRATPLIRHIFSPCAAWAISLCRSGAAQEVGANREMSIKRNFPPEKGLPLEFFCAALAQMTARVTARRFPSGDRDSGTSRAHWDALVTCSSRSAFTPLKATVSCA
jgi:transcriptional regulator with GAF, ATPase, and Fis domain